MSTQRHEREGSSDGTREITINTGVLLREPGRSKHIHLRVDPTEIGVVDSRLIDDIDVDILATSSVDSINLHGSITIAWHTTCRRCMVDVGGHTTADIDEIYQRHPDSEDVFPIEGDQIDVAPIIAQYTLLELPEGVLCREDCAGLCSECGTDKNQSSCGCVEDRVDPRWAVLSELVVDNDSSA